MLASQFSRHIAYIRASPHRLARAYPKKAQADASSRRASGARRLPPAEDGRWPPCRGDSRAIQGEMTPLPPMPSRNNAVDESSMARPRNIEKLRHGDFYLSFGRSSASRRKRRRAASRDMQAELHHYFAHAFQESTPSRRSFNDDKRLFHRQSSEARRLLMMPTEGFLYDYRLLSPSRRMRG